MTSSRYNENIVKKDINRVIHPSMTTKTFILITRPVHKDLTSGLKLMVHEFYKKNCVGKMWVGDGGINLETA